MEKSKKAFYKKWWFVLLVIVVIGIFVTGLGNDGVKFSWSDMELGELLPVPKSNVGKVSSNSNNYLRMYVYKTSYDDYKEYIKACEEKGYAVESDKGESSYYAYNSEGYRLGLSYDRKDEELSISLDAPEEMKKISWATNGIGNMLPIPKSDMAGANDNTDDSMDNNVDNNTDSDSDAGETTEAEENSTERIDGIRTEFKKAMDSYEAFYREYCEVLKKYNSNPTDLLILTEYTELLGKSVEMSEKFEAWDESEMSEAELKYYVEVSGRVTKMLIEVGQ